MPSRFTTHAVNLEPSDAQIVRDFASEIGLNRNGFSAALRFILRDWNALRLLAAPSRRRSLKAYHPSPPHPSDPEYWGFPPNPSRTGGAHE
jgi:hypothetical protein